MYCPLGYKPALDGLRGLAVFPVLLFRRGQCAISVGGYTESMSSS